MTPRQPIGVLWGEGVSKRVLHSTESHICMTPSRMVTPAYFATRIRVKKTIHNREYFIATAVQLNKRYLKYS